MSGKELVHDGVGVAPALPELADKGDHNEGVGEAPLVPELADKVHHHLAQSCAEKSSSMKAGV